MSKSERFENPIAKKDFGIKVEIKEEVFEKIMYWIDKADFEVSGLGKLVHDKESNTFTVIDAMLLKQEGSGAATEIDAGAICKAMFDLKDTPGELKWWWHSHVDMQVFWSSTDVATIKELSAGGWFLSTVFNKRREVKSAYSQSGPICLIADDLETDILAELNKELTDKWDAEFDKNVTQKSYAVNLGEYFDKKDQKSYPVLDELFKRDSDHVPAWRKHPMWGVVKDTEALTKTASDDGPVFDEDDIETLKSQGFLFDDYATIEDDKLDIRRRK